MSFFCFLPPSLLQKKIWVKITRKIWVKITPYSIDLSERKPIHSRSAKLPNGRIDRGPRPNATSNAMPLWNLVAAAAAAAPLRPPAATAAASLAPSHPLHCPFPAQRLPRFAASRPSWVLSSGVEVKLGVDVEQREARAVACFVDATSRASRCWCCGADHVGKFGGLKHRFYS